MTAEPQPPEATIPAPRKRGPSLVRARGNIEDFGAGRACSVPGCTTVISRYHRGVVCWAHDDEPPKR